MTDRPSSAPRPSLGPGPRRLRPFKLEVIVIGRRCSALVLLGSAAVLAACVAGPSTTGTGHSPSSEVASAVPDGAAYVVGAGDSLSVFVYRSPELSVSELPVRPDGRISVPLIEDIEAAGRTPTQLARDIEQRLRKYVKEPSVTVIVRGFVGPLDRQVKVIGEATEPIALPYRDHMTVLDVMIATKGLTKFAAGNSAVIVRRTGEGRQATIKVHLADLVKDGDITQNVEMAPGDTLIIPQTWF